MYVLWGMYMAHLWWLELSSSSTVKVVVGGKQQLLRTSYFAQCYLVCCLNSQLFHLVGISVSAKLHDMRWIWRLQVPSYNP